MHTHAVAAPDLGEKSSGEDWVMMQNLLTERQVFQPTSPVRH